MVSARFVPFTDSGEPSVAQTLRTYPMTEAERRSDYSRPANALKKELNQAQIDALTTLEQFGWYIKFVRHNPPNPPVAVLCDPDMHRFAILDAAGELHENPLFENFRKSSDR